MRHLLLLAFMVLSIFSHAQVLRGTVMDARSDSPLGGATIFNHTQNIYKRASFEGKFSVIAASGDTVIFSSAGYRPDTVVLSQELLSTGIDIGLSAMPVFLDTVLVNNRSYAEDSLQRREDYSHFYRFPPRDATGGNTPQYGFGIVLSPFTFFSRKERAKRRLRAQLKHNEEQAFIDYYFTPSYVQRVTGLKGAMLQKFMRMYRPSYSFVRKANKDDLLRYINESYKAFALRFNINAAIRDTIKPTGNTSM